MTEKIPVEHPGVILKEEFLDPLEISQNKLALALRVPARRINEIVLGKRGITADTALRLAAFFGNSARFWMNLQDDYELRMTKREKESELKSIKRHAA